MDREKEKEKRRDDTKKSKGPKVGMNGREERRE